LEAVRKNTDQVEPLCLSFHFFHCRITDMLSDEETVTSQIIKTDHKNRRRRDSAHSGKRCTQYYDWYTSADDGLLHMVQ